MSSFLTRIPLDLESTKKLLPKGSQVESVVLNGTELELRWQNHLLVTPWSFHADFTVEQLAERKLPEGVKQRETPKSVPTQVQAKIGSSAATRKSKRA